ncbi:MAG: flippase-like domain-containing protein [Clostridia bacterium]|nr:flippase-like domain-containing protein [Clostridia bacterium]
MKNKVMVIVGLIISLVFVYIAFKGINFSKAAEALGKINYWVIIPAIFIQTSSYYVRSIRWSYMLQSIKRMKASKLFSTLCISYAVNNTMPLRAGDFARAYLIGKKESVSATAAFSSIIIEKIYDGIILLMFLGTVAFAFPFSPWVRRLGIIISCVFFGALLFTIFLVAFRDKTMGFVKYGLKFLPDKPGAKILDLIEKLVDGFEIIKDKKNLIPIALLSILIWLMEASMLFAVAAAFGLDNKLYLSILTLVAVNFAMMVPSSPGYIGPFEVACIQSLNLFKISATIGAAFSIIYRVAIFVPLTVIGYAYLIKEGISISQLTSKDKSKGK